jgi:hypothetical protein
MDSGHGRSIAVHKAGEEGTISYGASTGKIFTPISERPEWCEGITTVIPQERLKFYSDRLGKDSEMFEAIQAATVVAFEDLAFIGIDAEQNEMEFHASDGHRMETLSLLLGIDRASGDIKDSLAEREVSKDNYGHSQKEINAIHESLEQGFQGQQASDKKQATGTKG